MLRSPCILQVSSVLCCVSRCVSHRWHIAIPWFIGGALMLVLPFAWMRKADEVSYTLLVLASMGIMGCDGECVGHPLLACCDVL